jgi:hypothetical protein
MRFRRQGERSGTSVVNIEIGLEAVDISLPLSIFLQAFAGVLPSDEAIELTFQAKRS